MTEDMDKKELHPTQKSNNTKTKKKTTKSQIKATVLVENNVENVQPKKEKNKYGKIISFKGNKARIICDGICYLVDKTNDMKVGNSYKIK